MTGGIYRHPLYEFDLSCHSTPFCVDPASCSLLDPKHLGDHTAVTQSVLIPRTVVYYFQILKLESKGAVALFLSLRGGGHITGISSRVHLNFLELRRGAFQSMAQEMHLCSTFGILQILLPFLFAVAAMTTAPDSRQSEAISKLNACPGCFSYLLRGRHLPFLMAAPSGRNPIPDGSLATSF